MAGEQGMTRGGRGGARGGRGGARGGRKDEDKEWIPVTKLGRLVKDGKIKSMDEIYRFSMPVKEHQIIDFFFPKLTDEVVKVMPVQKQTQAGQRTRFKAFVILGDNNGHVGLGVKCSKEVSLAIKGAMALAKLSIIPIRLGHWGNVIGEPHTVPAKVTGKCGSSLCRLVPAPRGTGIVSSTSIKKLLQLAGIEDCYTQSRGKTKTLGNFIKATFAAIGNTTAYMTPDLWAESPVEKSPFQQHSEYLARADARASR
jgi:small subunit ribosomal protein S2e